MRVEVIMRAHEREAAEEKIRDGISDLLLHETSQGDPWFSEDEVRQIVNETFEDVIEAIRDEEEEA